MPLKTPIYNIDIDKRSVTMYVLFLNVYGIRNGSKRDCLLENIPLYTCFKTVVKISIFFSYARQYIKHIYRFRLNS